MGDNTGTAEAEKAEAPDPKVLAKFEQMQRENAMRRSEGAQIGGAIAAMPAAQVEANAKRHREDAWRHQALHLAAQTFGHMHDAGFILKAARDFETYLKGE